MCSYSTHRRGNYNVHMRKHTGEKPFSCTNCSQTFTQKISLQRHIMKAICTQKRNKKKKIVVVKFLMRLQDKTVLPATFKCTYCAYKTWNKSNMKVHLRTHSGEKPFKCPSCSKCFTQKISLQRHMRFSCVVQLPKQ
nr:oocyte zinc finger protein XlCOF6-like [Parasteatoda tepidariorum]